MESSSETNTSNSEAQKNDSKPTDSQNSAATHETFNSSSNESHQHEHEKQSNQNETKPEFEDNVPQTNINAGGVEAENNLEITQKEKVDEAGSAGQEHHQHHGTHKHEELTASENSRVEELVKESVDNKDQVAVAVNNELEGLGSTQEDVNILADNKEEIIIDSQGKTEEIILVPEKNEEVKENFQAVSQTTEEYILEQNQQQHVNNTHGKEKVEVREEIKEDIKEVVTLSEAQQDMQTLGALASNIIDEFSNWMRLDDAYQHYQDYLQLASQIRKKNIAEVNEFIENLNREHHRNFLDICDNYQYMKKFTTEIENESGWTTEKSSEGYTIKYKTGGTAIASVKIEGIMDVPLLNLLTLIYEIDLYNRWLPFVKTTTELKAINKGFKVSYMKLSIPPPLSDRETLLTGFGVDRFKTHGTVLILARSTDNDKVFIKDHKIVLPPDSTGALLAINTAGFEFKYLGPDKVRMRSIVNFDPLIRFLPNMVMSWLLRKSGSLIFSKMYKGAKNYKGSVWEERLNSNSSKEFYEWLIKRIEQEVAHKPIIN